MTPLGLPVGCIACAGTCRLVNSTSNGQLAIGVVECQDCYRQWEISARIIPHAIPQDEYNRRARARAKAKESACP